ncbi:MAG: dTDP-4-dehydrorhamnose 3,5-epimerase [Flaviaesturariibacter sp.]|nr:dTDP-4-dehydrorhamnose 3,5-epimerase [Flaviaesturariibacter sp.]
MGFTTCDITGLVIIEPQVFEDDRGYFFEAYNEKRFKEAGIACDFIQDNQSKSSYGVIRGLHYQLPPYAQSKLVRVLEGSIIDVAVDLRKGSPTFGKQFSIELSADNKKQLFIPHGFAHGFSVLSQIAIVLYKCDQYYNKQSEAGIRFNDETLAIDWGIPPSQAVISEKDAILPAFSDCINTFTY